MGDAESHKLKVLIVEDSRIVSDRISDMLSELGFISLMGAARNFSEAFSMTHSVAPDVVLLDLKLSGKSGVDVLVEMKKNKHTKVIMLTNHAEPHDRKKCRDAGADYFFDKTIDFEKIPEALNTILQTKMNNIVETTRYEKVLVIDDDEMDIFISNRTMKTANFAKEIVMKTSVRDAIDYLKKMISNSETLPEIIFLDLNFPDKNGFDFLKEFKEISKDAKTKSNIMILTNSLNSDSMMVQIMLTHPMVQAFLEKPLTLETLKDI